MANLRARNSGKSEPDHLAEFIRRAVREHLPVRGEGAWMKYAGLVTTGDPRSSQSIDELVYGTKD